MTALISRLRPSTVVSFGFLAGSLVMMSIVIAIAASSPPSKVSRLCDEMVDRLLTTTDPVELRRAMFLVRWFDCGIRRRLP